MASAYKAELYDLGSVMDFYNECDGVVFSVYAGTYCKPEFCRWSYEGNEKTEGAQVLQQALVALKQNTDNTNTYTLQVVKKAASKGRGKTVVEQKSTQISFRLNNPERFYPYGQQMGAQNNDSDLKEILKEMQKTNSLILSKMAAQELEEEEDEQPQGGIAGLLSDPQFKDIAIAGIAALVNSFVRPSNAAPDNFAQPQALAGIPGEDQKGKALCALVMLENKDELYGDHLLYLANLPDAKYKMLLSFIQ